MASSSNFSKIYQDDDFDFGDDDDDDVDGDDDDKDDDDDDHDDNDDDDVQAEGWIAGEGEKEVESGPIADDHIYQSA